MLVVPASPAHAELKTWDAGAGTSKWHDAATWSPDGVPQPGDDAFLDNTVRITLDGANASVASVTSNGTPLDVDGVTLTITGTTNGAAPSMNVFGGGTLSITGTF